MSTETQFYIWNQNSASFFEQNPILRVPGAVSKQNGAKTSKNNKSTPTLRCSIILPPGLIILPLHMHWVAHRPNIHQNWYLAPPGGIFWCNLGRLLFGWPASPASQKNAPQIAPENATGRGKIPILMDIGAMRYPMHVQGKDY